MGFRIGDMLVDEIKFAVGSGYEDDFKYVAESYVRDYLGCDPGSMYVLIPYEDGNTEKVLCNALKVIHSDEYKFNKRLLLDVFNSTVSNTRSLPDILLKNGFYFESIVAALTCNKILLPTSLQLVACTTELCSNFPDILPRLSRQEAEIVLELLNANGMAKEAAMLLDACKNCDSGVTDFDL